MNRSLQTSWHFLSLLVLLFFSFTGGALAQTMDETIHVNVAHSSASDTNPGTESQPLKTLQKAVDQAMDNKDNSISTRVVIHPGIYREAIELGNPGVASNSTPIVFEAKKEGTAVVSGADVYTDWQQEGNYLVTDWNQDLSAGISKINERQEIVAVNGEMLTQVMSKGELGPGSEIFNRRGSFYVDDMANKIYLQPASDVDPKTATIEVGVRGTIWNQKRVNNVTIRGLVFEYATTEWGGGKSAFRISGGKNVTVENCNYRWNNWVGFYAGDAEDITLLNTTMNNNGGQGWNTWYVKGWYSENTETSYNNWRGYLGGHTGWDVGNKLMAIHDGVIKDHVAQGNYSRGLWLDYDMEDIVLDNIVVENNLLDGAWFEANQGPIVLKNSVIRNNGRSGLRTTYTTNVTLDNNLIAYNATDPDEMILNDSQIIIDGGEEDPCRPVSNFETGEEMCLNPANWTLTNNTIIGSDVAHEFADGPTLIDTDFSGDDVKDDWANFINTLEADNNVYYHGNREAVFGFPEYEDLTLAEWQSRTGQDQSSVFKEPSEAGEDSEQDGSSDSPSDDSGSEQSGVKEVTASTDQLPLYFGDSLGVQRSVNLNMTPENSQRAELLVTAYDVNQLNEATVYVNGTAVSLPDSITGMGESKRASVILDPALLVTGDNKVTFEMSQRVDGAQDRFRYRVDEVTVRLHNKEEETVSTGREDQQSEQPKDFTLEGNYPNPFNPSTTIVFDLPVHAEVGVNVYDMLGRQVMSLPVQSISAGSDQKIQVDASHLASGTYLYRLTARTSAKTLVKTGRMTLVK